jgi:hypothetical protein
MSAYGFTSDSEGLKFGIVARDCSTERLCVNEEIGIRDGKLHSTYGDLDIGPIPALQKSSPMPKYNI